MGSARRRDQVTGVIMLRLFGLVVAVAVAMAAHAAEAQPYPSRPIRLLLVYPPGGAADLVARAVGQPLAARHGKPNGKPNDGPSHEAVYSGRPDQRRRITCIAARR